MPVIPQAHVDLSFTAPTEPLSQNQAIGAHWGAVKRSLEPWGTAAWAAARNWRIRARRGPHAGHQHPITVQVVIPFRVGRRRDPHNYTSTVVKAVVDGLVRAQIIPDDTPNWVTVLDPLLVIQKDPAPLTATIRIRPREN